MRWYYGVQFYKNQLTIFGISYVRRAKVKVSQLHRLDSKSTQETLESDSHEGRTLVLLNCILHPLYLKMRFGISCSLK